MPDCTTCAYAEWQRTKAGRLHPSGAGKCTWDGWKRWMKKWVLPKAFYNLSGTAFFYGGHISRRDPHTNCHYYQPND